MAETLDEEWNRLRGMEIQSVGIASISYDEESQKLINMRNQGAMLGDPSVREGYVQGAMARGFEAAGSNGSGAMAGFMGMGAGMNFGGGFTGRRIGVQPAADADAAGGAAGICGTAGRLCAGTGEWSAAGWLCTAAETDECGTAGRLCTTGRTERSAAG